MVKKILVLVGLGISACVTAYLSKATMDKVTDEVDDLKKTIKNRRKQPETTLEAEVVNEEA